MSEYPFVFQTTRSDPRPRYVPVMVTRLLLSLKKAATSPRHERSIGELTMHTTIRFAEHRGGAITRDEIHMDTFVSTHEETQSQTYAKEAAEDFIPSSHRMSEGLAT